MYRMSCDVKGMNVIKQVSNLSMGWCINCHRTKKVDFTIIGFIHSTEIWLKK